ncbi:MAG: hypothetical protein M1828_000302 [Chrysothrix sp. TS-e1954]|nr:MAG: hypothetical protein M1828_000302 [Chrysothrix sp. TS-e1954]
MVPLPGKRTSGSQSLNQSLAIGRSKDQSTKRSQPTSYSNTGARSKHPDGAVTPTKSKVETEVPEETIKPGALGQPSSRKSPIVKSDFDDTRYEDKDRMSRRWGRDHRKESKATASSVDGPILRPKPGRVPSLPVSHAAEDLPLRTSYAHAAAVATLPSRPPQYHSIQLSPSPGLSSMTARGGLPTSLNQQRLSTLNVEDSFGTHSTAPSSVFDRDEVEDNVSVSDLETEPSHLIASYEVATEDVKVDDRLLQPDIYFSALESLEGSVVSNSGLFLLRSGNRQHYPKESSFALKFTFESYSPFAIDEDRLSNDATVIDHCVRCQAFGPAARSASSEALSADLGYWAFHILECRNVMLAVKSNVARMRAERFVGSIVSILVIDPIRTGVAKLQKIDLDRIENLHRAFEDALAQIVPLLLSQRPQRSSRVQSAREDLELQCQSLLQSLDLPHGGTIAGTWRRAVLVLDLALTSYCGAHQERFDEKFLHEDLNLAKMTPAWTYDTSSTPTIMLRRRRLRCLDKLLQSPVWVLQDSRNWQDSAELYLSTDVETFADIWGPLWSVKRNDSDEGVLGYRVGLGSIVPWPTNDEKSKLTESEIFCHWSESDLTVVHSHDSLKVASRLLIGAATLTEQTTSQLKENPMCSTRTGEIIQQLRSTHRVEEMGTSAEERYLAEECVTAQFGYSGISLGGQRTYKRRCGVFLKQAICEEWQNNSSGRNPAILEHYIGLEVSFCSGNARRRRLKDIFNTRTVNYWLESCKSHSVPFPCEDAFYAALESPNPRAFRDLWNQRREWRQDLGKLVSWCLDGLAKSKIDTEGALHVLWMPRDDKRLMVKMKQSQGYAWTSFLTDSRSHCTMAIMSCKCLHSDYKYASSCKKKNPNGSGLGYSVLETALVINEKAPRPKAMEQRASQREKVKQARWSISRLQSGDKLPVIGGRLQVREVFANTRLLVEWEQGVSKKIHDYRSSITRTVGVESFYHWELRDEEDAFAKPVPLLVISQNRDKR